MKNNFRRFIIAFINVTERCIKKLCRFFMKNTNYSSKVYTDEFLIYTAVDLKYLEFAILYPAFALASNPNAIVEIGCVGEDAWKKLNKVYKEFVKFYSKTFQGKVVFRKIRNEKILPNSVRFIIAPETHAKYVYIGDSDIFITEPIFEAHLLNISRNNLDFSNIKRLGQNKLSGLHFIEYDKMFPASLPLFANLQTKNDEDLLPFLKVKATAF